MSHPSIPPASPLPPPLGQKPLPPAPSLPTRHHRLRWTLVSVAGVLVVLAIVAGWLLYRAVATVNTQKLDGTNRKLSFFQQLTHLVTQQDTPIQGEAEDRINILLLGIGGPGHDGPYLADTIMVASLKPSTNEVAMLSIPRDLVVNIPGYNFRKINNVIAFGRDKKYPGGGEALAVKIVGDFLDLPIQYYARVDFQGFEDVIDALDGVEISVEKTFADFQYPTTNYGYQTIRFTKGTQEMNGDMALKYSRSRHGNNGEGSDFARAARQQKVIIATKDKALSLGTLTNPKKVGDLMGVIGEHHQTNMEVWEMVRLAQLASDVKNDTIVNQVLDNSVNGLLKQGVGSGGAYILSPVDETMTDIHFLVKNIFLIGRAQREQAPIVVANATGRTGLAERIGKTLGAYGLDVQSPFTLRDTEVPQTVIVDATNGKYPATNELIGRYIRVHGTFSLTTWESSTDDTTLRPRLISTSTNTNGVNKNTNRPPVTTQGVGLILGKDQAQNATARSNASARQP